MAHIVRIETAGPDQRARRLYVSDTEEPLTTSASVVRVLGIEPDAVVDDAFLESLATAQDEQMRERAQRLLAHRERTTHEVRTRLVNDGYPRADVDALVERYQELGLIDDDRFAGMHARTRIGAGYGTRRVADELVRKGIDREAAQRAAAEAVGDDPQNTDLERARAVLRGAVATDRRSRERLIRKLVTRGFPMSVALDAVNDPGGEGSGVD